MVEYSVQCGEQDQRSSRTQGQYTPLVPLVTQSTTGGGGGTHYDGLHREALPKSGTFLRLQVYGKVGISLVEVYRRVGKSVIWVRERAQKG